MTFYYINDVHLAALRARNHVSIVCDDNVCAGSCAPIVARNNGALLYSCDTDARAGRNHVGVLQDGGFITNQPTKPTNERPSMLIDQTPVSPSVLLPGDVFVWENTEHNRTNLVITVEHTQHVYRVTDNDPTECRLEYVPATGDTSETSVKYWDLSRSLTLYRVQASAFPAPEDATETFLTNVTLTEAMVAARPGGEVMRAGIRYTVGASGLTLTEQGTAMDYDRPELSLLTFGWDVTAIGDGATLRTPSPSQDATPQTSGHLLPRTADEARQLASMLTAIADKLPGGELEQAGREVADYRNLCEVYERVVTEVFGWAPRPSMGRGRQYAWEASVADIEARHSGDYAAMLRTASQRYERGGPVNVAILDAMRTNLEDHKVDDVNEVLERCGLDGLSRDREFRVTTRIQGYALQTRRVPVYQYVSTAVTAADEDEAVEYAQENEDMTDLASRYDWTEDEDDASDWDTDLSDVEDITEDWDVAEAEEA